MGREYVGIDFHRRRSVVVRMSPHGKRLSVVRIDNSPSALAEAVTAAGDRPQVVLEATYGWYWAVDVLQQLGATVHLAITEMGPRSRWRPDPVVDDRPRPNGRQTK